MKAFTACLLTGLALTSACADEPAKSRASTTASADATDDAPASTPATTSATAPASKFSAGASWGCASGTFYPDSYGTICPSGTCWEIKTDNNASLKTSMVEGAGWGYPSHYVQCAANSQQILLGQGACLPGLTRYEIALPACAGGYGNSPSFSCWGLEDSISAYEPDTARLVAKSANYPGWVVQCTKGNYRQLTPGSIYQY